MHSQGTLLAKRPLTTSSLRPGESSAAKEDAAPFFPTVNSENFLPAFLVKLFDLVSQEDSNIITWCREGGVVIGDPAALQSRVLRKYFEHSNLTSFVRQLNMYGFRKARGARSKLVYYNSKFQKERKDLLEDIKRKPPGSCIEQFSDEQAPITQSEGKKREGKASRKKRASISSSVFTAPATEHSARHETPVCEACSSHASHSQALKEKEEQLEQMRLQLAETARSLQAAIDTNQRLTSSLYWMVHQNKIQNGLEPNLLEPIVDSGLTSFDSTSLKARRSVNN